MLKNISFFSLCISMLLTTACTKSCQKKSDNGIDAKDSAAVVNGAGVSLSKLDDLHKRTVSQMQQAGQELQPDMDRKVRGNILRRLIDDELISQKAKELSIAVDRADREEALENYKNRMGGPKAYEALLKQGSATEEQIVDSLVGEITRKKILEKYGSKIEVTEDEISGYYEANKQLYNLPEMVHARHILLKVANTESPEKIEEVKKKALNILEEAKKPGANFEALAEKYSEGPSQKQKGDLGFFARGRMVKEFEDTVFNAPIKTAVGPVKTDFGFHIIYVEEKKPAHLAEIAEVRDKITESLKRNKQARKSEEILSGLRKDAKVKIQDSSITEEEYAEFVKKTQVADKK